MIAAAKQQIKSRKTVKDEQQKQYTFIIISLGTTSMWKKYNFDETDIESLGKDYSYTFESDHEDKPTNYVEYNTILY